jgi:EAL domain-containing protein (putative c-di-GMP-specific phosphodiesterase class I)/CheY-like chemotaxis protein
VASIKVLIADDSEAIRALLAEAIKADPSLELVGAAGDAKEAIELALRHQPNVALLDVEMPGGGGPRAAREIRVCCPDIRVVALSGHDDRTSVLEMVRAGAAGYLVKNGRVKEIIGAIHRAVAGQAGLSPEVATQVLDELSGRLRTERQESRRFERQQEAIRRVLDTPEALTMAYQPIFDLRTSNVVGLEALARFTDGSRGPEAWFHDAEGVGMRLELELAAVRIAMQDLDHLPHDAYLSVNLSPDAATSDGFRDLLTEVSVDRIVVEVTEHTPVDDYEALRDFLGGLKTRGMRLAIDDAGAGFSSFRHILRLAPDIIKMDVSLTRGIDSDGARRAFARSLISFASSIGATLVAEGVETRAELDALRALDVRYGQGFFLARPAPLRALTDRREAL